VKEGARRSGKTKATREESEGGAGPEKHTHTHTHTAKDQKNTNKIRKK